MHKLSIPLLLLILSASPFVFSATLESTPNGFFPFVAAAISEELVNSRLQDVLNHPLTFGGGAACEICVALVGASIRYTGIHNITVDDFLTNKFCPMFPSELSSTCTDIIKKYGPTIINSLVKYASPDIACREIKVCNNPQCNLFKKKKFTVNVSANWVESFLSLEAQPQNQTKSPLNEFMDPMMFAKYLVDGPMPYDSQAFLNWLGEPRRNGAKGPLDWIKAMIQRLATNHTPPIDIDGDYFSQLSGELRGYNWRGRDCNDNNAKIYPGRKSSPSPGLGLDYNCNGISGHDPTTHQEYKESLCANSGQMGVIVMGDSAGAHAEIPRAWIDGAMWNTTTFKEILTVAANEVDLPHMSAYTGYAEVGNTGPVSSVYKKLLERNRCNFRDYQNIAVNGARATNSLENIMRISRVQATDHPVLIFLELIGNDVCSGHEDFDHFTDPEDFREKITGILDYLDTVVPPGSHLVALGLVNGSLIYTGVKDKIHPAGVSYPDLYDFQNCLETSMCWGWLNNNDTVREITTQHAFKLNQVYRDLVGTYKAKNFDWTYYDFPAQQIWDAWVAEGNDPYLLIEPTDGFHPSQIFHAKLGDHLWDTLMADHPDWLGEVNPNNDRIQQLFGNQGGY